MRAWYDAQMAMGLHCVVHVPSTESIWQQLRDGINADMKSKGLAWGHDDHSDSPGPSSIAGDMSDPGQFEDLPWDVYIWPPRFGGKDGQMPRWKFILNSNPSPEYFVVANISGASKRRHYRPWNQGHPLYGVAQMIIGSLTSHITQWKH